MSWKDPWKLSVENHRMIRELHERLRTEVRTRHNRSLPLADELLDRWERAEFLGFGKESSVYDSCLVLGDVQVGEHTWIGPNTVLDGSAGLSIGAWCTICAGVQIYTHDTVEWALSGGRAEPARSPTRIGDCCYLAPNVIVGRGVTVGSHSLIGALAFVKDDVPPYSIVVGAPGRVVGRVELSESGKVRLRYERG